MVAKAIAAVPQEATQPPVRPVIALKPADAGKDLVYRFKISRRATPLEFRNLWELAVKGPDDKDWRVEIDADMLSTVITRINYIFEQDGL